MSDIQKASMVCRDSNRHQKSMEEILEVGSIVSVPVNSTSGPVERLGALRTET